MAMLLVAACSAGSGRGRPIRDEGEALQAIATGAYGGLSENAAALGVRLTARVATGVLAAGEHHARMTERRRPQLDGYYFYARARGEAPKLNLVPGAFIHDQPYSPDSPVKHLVVLEVSGAVDGHEVAYDAFLLRYESPQGECSVALIDPVVPAAMEFVDDAGVEAVFPGCQGPQRAREQAVRDAIPGLEIASYDKASGTFEGRVPEGDGRVRTDHDSACPDYFASGDLGFGSSPLCSDAWFGYGNWVHGGKWWQAVDCEMSGGRCTVQTVQSRDSLHSSIDAKGWGRCDCCSEYGVGVSGGRNHATLQSRADGTTGGHVAIAKTVEAHRTSTHSSRSELKLNGACKGDLDLPAHGASGSGSAGVDYTTQNSSIANQAQVASTDVDNHAIHKCLPR